MPTTQRVIERGSIERVRGPIQIVNVPRTEVLVERSRPEEHRIHRNEIRDVPTI